MADYSCAYGTTMSQSRDLCIALKSLFDATSSEWSDVPVHVIARSPAPEIEVKNLPSGLTIWVHVWKRSFTNVSRDFTRNNKIVLLTCLAPLTIAPPDDMDDEADRFVETIERLEDWINSHDLLVSNHQVIGIDEDTDGKPVMDKDALPRGIFADYLQLTCWRMA